MQHPTIIVAASGMHGRQGPDRMVVGGAVTGCDRPEGVGNRPPIQKRPAKS